MSDEPAFDDYAENYEAALATGIGVSGETSEYFAHGRIAWLANYLRRVQMPCDRVMDFGCGTGAATPFFSSLLGSRSILGIDPSGGSLKVAQRQFGSERAQFLLPTQYQPRQEVDLVFCNCAFHHIPLDERSDAVDYVHRSLRSGGLFALWENNPWNPATRYIMSRCVFDRDAITLTPPQACRLMRAGGFEIVRVDFYFIFPRALRWLRGIEPWVSRLPLGAQYQVLCRKS